ncbi:hypothetical protein BDV25DRAFT_137386 [Aspergillus avenaceus]|uniref:Uncharacterized protein n=1 Tax=Aspergillus avenaceus TaxID=36643 RepID=A0A5N6U2W3_ASPAV|nr:hypothetical protein BDV25DRAFT_137386 [Aspergillus avenaceus]
MGPQHLRVLEAYFDGTNLIIRQTKLLEMKNYDADTVDILARWWFGYAIGETKAMPEGSPICNAGVGLGPWEWFASQGLIGHLKHDDTMTLVVLITPGDDYGLIPIICIIDAERLLFDSMITVLAKGSTASSNKDINLQPESTTGLSV